MKSFLSVILALVCALTLSACGCSNNMGETQTPGTTLMPDILPTLDTNIPDPDVDTQMPIYTDGTDSTEETDMTIPMDNQQRNRK